MRVMDRIAYILSPSTSLILVPNSPVPDGRPVHVVQLQILTRGEMEGGIVMSWY